MNKVWKLSILIVGLLAVVGLQVFAASPIKITFNTLFHEADAQAMQKIIDNFNATHTDVQVELTQGGWTQYYAQMKLAVMAGNAPQLGICHANKLVEMADYLTPLDDSPVGNILQMAGFNPDDYVSANWKAGELNGHHYLIPLDTHGWGLWYNKDIFKAAGLDPNNPPQNLADFINACDKIKAAGYYAFHPAEDAAPRKLRRAWYVFYWQMGGQLFDKNYTHATFNNPKGLLALQFLVDIFHDFGWNKPGSNGYDQFAAGKLGMLIAGNWYYGTAVSSGVNWGYAPMPNFFGIPYTWGNSHQLAIPLQPKGTPKAVYLAAAEVIKYISEHSHIWTMYGGHITAYKSEATNPELLASDYWTKSGKWLNEMAQKGLVHFPINNPHGSELEQAIQAQIQLAVNGQITPQEALNKAEADCNKILQGK